MGEAGDLAGGMVPEVPDFIKASWEGAVPRGGVGEMPPPISSRMATPESAYHAVRISVSPPAWLLFLTIALLAMSLLARKPKLWLLVQRISGRISWIWLPGILALGLGQGQTSKTKPQKKRQNKRQRAPMS